jgi:hypothetical protein
MLNAITTWLEIVGLILLAVAAGIQLSVWSLPGGLAMAGLVLIGEAALIGWRSQPKGKSVGDETA